MNDKILENYELEYKKIEKEISDLWEVGKNSKAKEKRLAELDFIIDGIIADKEIRELRQEIRYLKSKLKRNDKMKKRYLKKWVEYSIIFIQFILIMILSADSDNLNVFIISKIIALLIFYINHLILKNYTRLYNLV